MLEDGGGILAAPVNEGEIDEREVVVVGAVVVGAVVVGAVVVGAVVEGVVDDGSFGLTSVDGGIVDNKWFAAEAWRG